MSWGKFTVEVVVGVEEAASCVVAGHGLDDVQVSQQERGRVRGAPFYKEEDRRFGQRFEVGVECKGEGERL